MGMPRKGAGGDLGGPQIWMEVGAKKAEWPCPVLWGSLKVKAIGQS